LTVDQIINLEDDIPQAVTLEDKTEDERLKLIDKLDEEDKSTIFKIIDKMLTNKKFKDFFDKKCCFALKPKKLTPRKTQKSLYKLM